MTNARDERSDVRTGATKPSEPEPHKNGTSRFRLPCRGYLRINVAPSLRHFILKQLPLSYQCYGSWLVVHFVPLGPRIQVLLQARCACTPSATGAFLRLGAQFVPVLVGEGWFRTAKPQCAFCVRSVFRVSDSRHVPRIGF